MTSTMLQRWTLPVVVLGVFCVGCRDKGSADRETDSPSADEEATHAREPAVEEPVKYIGPRLPEEDSELWGIPARELLFTEWATSDDGALSLRLMAPKAGVHVDDPIILLMEMRNNTDEPITMFRPFAESIAGVAISGPDGEVVHTGPVASSTFGAGAFVSIPGGYVLLGRRGLYVADYAGSDEPGHYTLTYHYVTGAYHQNIAVMRGVCAESELWPGEIYSEPITIEKR